MDRSSKLDCDFFLSLILLASQSETPEQTDLDNQMEEVLFYYLLDLYNINSAR